MKPQFCRLPHRKLISVSGPDALPFLQNFTSVDVRKVENNKLTFGAFLNPKGRILFDFFMNKQGDNMFQLETQESTRNDLVSYLQKFKMRKKVSIALDQEQNVFSLWGGGPFSDLSCFPDPRVSEMGYRLWSSSTVTPSLLANEETEANVYHQRRIRLGLAEGQEESADQIPFVLNYDFLPGALSFDKGCYTGQELIARTHFKGQVRKRILPVEAEVGTTFVVGGDLLLEKDVENDDGVVGEGKVVAVAPGMPHFALASFRDAHLVTGEVRSHVWTNEEDGKRAIVRLHRPLWWPSAAA